jgi:hypothetical protein
MVAAGYPQRQAVAASLSNADRHPRAAGGGIAYRDVGGGIAGAPITQPTTTMAPQQQQQLQQYSQMTVEQLQQLAAQYGNSPQGQMVQKVLQQKKMMPQAAQTATPTPPQGQGIAAAQPGMASGGILDSMKMRRLSRPRFDEGGDVPEMPWFGKAEARELATGYLHGATSGRADKIITQAPGGAYVIPADVIAGLGDGNNLAGAKIMNEVLKTGPAGTALPRGARGSGPPRPPALRIGYPDLYSAAKGGRMKHGEGEPVDVALSHGEMVLTPEQVRWIGGGDLKKGHARLDKFVKKMRGDTIKKMRKLPGPVGAAA